MTIDPNASLVFEDDLEGLDPESLEGGGLIPAGTYDVTIDDVALDAGGEGTVDKIVIRMKITEGPQKGETIFDRFPVPTAGEKAGTKRNRNLLLYRLGKIDKSDLDSGRVRVDWSELEGMEAAVTLIHREWNGKTYANVDFGGYNARGWRPDGETAAKTPAKAQNFGDI